MKKCLIFLVLSIYFAAGRPIPAGAPPPVGLQLPGMQPTAARIQARQILEWLYQGQPDSALTRARAFVADNPGEPLPLLITARVMRETLSDQDDEKKLIEEDARPIIAILEQAIEICDKQLDSDGGDGRALFYRGWAWMFKAQLDALSANYWSAGRCSKKGKNDLDKYLKLHPGDPDASGMLGTFLYFADTLPTVIKIIKTIFLIPGGDKERGIDLLRYASSQDAMLSIDHEIILSAVFTIFEGRFEEGVHSFSSLLLRYPAYLRLVEPLGVLTTLEPREIREFQALQANALERHLEHNPGAVDWPTIHRISYHRSYSAMLYNPPTQAIEAFKTLIADSPRRPDWLMPLSMINLGMLYANTAQREKAEKMFTAVLLDKRMERFHDEAEKMLESLDDNTGKLTGIFPQLVTALYDGDIEQGRFLLGAFKRSAGETVYYDFYDGDLELIAGNREAAERSYRRALDRDVPEYAQIYQMLAASRLAEFYGTGHDFETAESLLEEALQYYHKEFLIDMLLKGRKRFYQYHAEHASDPDSTVPLPGTGQRLPASLLR